MDKESIGREIAALLWSANAIHITSAHPFILTAGWASPVYVDCRLLIDTPTMRRRVTDLATEYLALSFAPDSFDVIAGAETAGIPFAAWIADRLSLRMRYVRKRPLGIGHNSQVEGGEVAGLRALLMDDLTSDGRSKIAFARGLRAAGAIVEHVLTIFYHDAFPGAHQRLEEEGLTLHALATWSDVLKADDGGRLSATDRKTIEHFLADPVDWSARNGGRAADMNRA